MKKTKFLAILLFAGMAMTACNDADDIFNSTPESAGTVTVTFEGSYWDALIDEPQYMGSMLYGDGSYSWKDEQTTLSSKLTNAWGDGMFWGGGIAISNYVYNDPETDATFEQQLAVTKTNGSKNFAVVYCDASMEFADGQARAVKSLEIIPTAYTLAVAQHGASGAKALTERGDHLTAVITGHNGKETTGVVKVALALEGGFLTSWYTVDLTSLGKITSLSFGMEGSDESPWGGLNTPCYFAIDNVAILK